jgi:hypothetical protein
MRRIITGLFAFYYGYDIVDLIYESSGLITKIFVIDNLYYGIRAELIEVLVSIKP